MAGFAGILVAASLRTLVAIQPQTLFDIDPARGEPAMLAIGPVGSGILDIVLLASSVVALVGELLAGNGLARIPVVLAAIGAFAAAIHAVGN